MKFSGIYTILVFFIGLLLSVTPSANGLDCSRFIDLGCGDRTVSGDTTTYIDSVKTYSCIGWKESGKEIVYRVFLDAGGEITATFTSITVDLDLFILSACDELECIGYGSLSTTARGLAPGYYYIVVDGYEGAEGPFTLDITSDCSYTPTPTCTPTLTPTPLPLPFFTGWDWVDDSRVFHSSVHYSAGGDPRMYDFEIVPTSGWIPAPDILTINLNRASKLPGCDYSLRNADLNFVYYRTFLYITGTLPSSAIFHSDNVDDGFKIMINGVDAGYGQIGHAPYDINILSYLRTAYCNEIIVTVVDNCTSLMKLLNGYLKINSAPVEYRVEFCKDPQTPQPTSTQTMSSFPIKPLPADNLPVTILIFAGLTVLILVCFTRVCQSHC